MAVCGQSQELLADAESFLLTDGRTSQGMLLEFEKAEAVVTLLAGLRQKELDNIRRFLQQP